MQDFLKEVIIVFFILAIIYLFVILIMPILTILFWSIVVVAIYRVLKLFFDNNNKNRNI